MFPLSHYRSCDVSPTHTANLIINPMTYKLKGPLDDDAIYSITGAALNMMYSDGMKNLENAVCGYEHQLPFSYAEAYWSGWCCATNGVRDIVRDMEIK